MIEAPNPPRDLQGAQQLQDVFEQEKVEVERSETVEVVLFDYEDENVSFCISFEFVYTFNQELDTEQIFA